MEIPFRISAPNSLADPPPIFGLFLCLIDGQLVLLRPDSSLWTVDYSGSASLVATTCMHILITPFNNKLSSVGDHDPRTTSTFRVN
ncbi:uncharacterized protein LOC110437374 isoform X2 [Sorghum bicolor]|nr:uncharacterized protein LOC110437374 isoform X2 [Sorghum bicolor]|eukprot:XP_021321506.1 uncharacterized protein LOC110437374 isoform X2 [Sorghum bicolor]